MDIGSFMMSGSRVASSSFDMGWIRVVAYSILVWQRTEWTLTSHVMSKFCLNYVMLS